LGLVYLIYMDILKPRKRLDKSVRTFLGRQLRLYYGIVESEIPLRFREMLRELEPDQSPKVVSLPLNDAR